MYYSICVFCVLDCFIRRLSILCFAEDVKRKQKQNNYNNIVCFSFVHTAVVARSQIEGFGASTGKVHFCRKLTFVTEIIQQKLLYGIGAANS